MKKLMILSALASSLFLGSCGSNEDEVIPDVKALENPQAPRGGDGLDGRDDQAGRGFTLD